MRRREDASDLQRQRLPARYLAMPRFDQLRPPSVFACSTTDRLGGTICYLRPVRNILDVS